MSLEGERPLALRSTITAADGTLLARLFKENRAPVTLHRVPGNLVEAVLAAEDAGFFGHPGYDLKSMARATLINVKEGEVVQGGSTITQQLVKNTFFRRPGRTLRRKLRELRLAIELERQYSKQEILERYLNTVYLGEGAYGVEAASETYFGHNSSTLSLPEASLIAALIKAPSAYDPRSHPRQARARRNYVLERMAELGHISPAQKTKAMNAPLDVTKDPPQISTREPYFVEAVRQEILTEATLGATEDARDRALREGGLRIETTLVPNLQEAAERSVRSILDQPGDPDAALVAIRPRSGEIVAMVGGRKWSASQVNLALGREGGGSGRQPGSAFKPIVAAAAVEAGIPLTARYESGPESFDLGRDVWTVTNAEGQDYGSLPLDEALVHSVNGVYARLGLELGPRQVASQAHLMGVRSFLPAYPSIALGATEVSVLDMAATYATLANGGTAVEPTTIKQIRLASGEILEPDQDVIESAVSPGTAYLLTRVLEQVIRRGTGTAAAIGRPAAGKTGTTDDYADAWFIGYTPQLVTAVWVGYPEGRIPMTSVHGLRVTGGTFPAQIWREFMIDALANSPVLDFELPKSDLVSLEIDPDSGLLASSWCPGKEKTMLRQLAPTEYCPMPPPPSPQPLPTASPAPVVTPSPSPSDEARRSELDTEDEGDKEGRMPSPAGSPTPTPSPSTRKDKPPERSSSGSKQSR